MKGFDTFSWLRNKCLDNRKPGLLACTEMGKRSVSRLHAPLSSRIWFSRLPNANVRLVLIEALKKLTPFGIGHGISIELSAKCVVLRKSTLHFALNSLHYEANSSAWR